MKDLNFEENLEVVIEKSNRNTEMTDVDDAIVMFGIGGGIVGGIIMILFAILGLEFLYSLLVFSVGMCSIPIALLTNKKIDKYKKKKALKSLETLSEELKNNDVNVNIDSLQKSLITDVTRKQINTNRKNQEFLRELVIKRFYLLDEEQQIKVLERTLENVKLENGERQNKSNFCLLENQDLDGIEMPSIVKVLEFKE